MRKENKKYLIRESELKEILQEIALLEVSDMHTRKYMARKSGSGNAALKTDGNVLGDFGNMLNGLYSSLFGQGNGTMGYGNQPVDHGKNADAHQPLNVAAAVNWLNSNAHQKSTGWCARYVRSALNAGGLGVPHGMPARAAYQYVRILPSNGWQEIPIEQAGQPCDVVVMDPHPGHKYGHIAMCLGNGRWASDFFQRTMHGLKVPPPRNVVHVYRYRNRV